MIIMDNLVSRSIVLLAVTIISSILACNFTSEFRHQVIDIKKSSLSGGNVSILSRLNSVSKQICLESCCNRTSNFARNNGSEQCNFVSYLSSDNNTGICILMSCFPSSICYLTHVNKSVSTFTIELNKTVSFNVDQSPVEQTTKNASSDVKSILDVLEMIGQKFKGNSTDNMSVDQGTHSEVKPRKGVIMTSPAPGVSQMSSLNYSNGREQLGKSGSKGRKGVSEGVMINSTVHSVAAERFLNESNHQPDGDQLSKGRKGVSLHVNHSADVNSDSTGKNSSTYQKFTSEPSLQLAPVAKSNNKTFFKSPSKTSSGMFTTKIDTTPFWLKSDIQTFTYTSAQSTEAVTRKPEIETTTAASVNTQVGETVTGFSDLSMVNPKKVTQSNNRQIEGYNVVDDTDRNAESTTENIFEHVTKSNQKVKIHLIIVSLFGIVLFVAVVIFVIKSVYAAWERRHYRRMDFLVDGMYDQHA